MRTTGLDEAKYVALTTYRRDGSAVATPVWLAPSENGYLVKTAVTTGKYKRIRNNSAVEIVACNARGVVRAGATAHKGTARILDAAGTEAAGAAIRKRYGLMARLVAISAAVGSKLRRKEAAPSAGLEITVDGDD